MLSNLSAVGLTDALGVRGSCGSSVSVADGVDRTS